MEAEVTTKMGNLETRMVKAVMMLENNNNISVVRSSKNPKEGNMGTVSKDRFPVLEDKVEYKPSLTLLGDSLVRHLDKEFCNKNKTRRLCYPGAMLKDITHEVYLIIKDTTKESVVVI